MSRPIRSILVPIDGSEGALHAARFAADLALNSAAELTLLYVVHTTTAETLGLASRTREQVQEGLKALAEGALRGARAVLIDEGLSEHRERIELGDPPAEIVNLARAERVDLIVMGSRGMGPVKGLLIGSVSESVVRRAPCPVTVVR